MRVLAPLLLLTSCGSAYQPVGAYCDFPWPLSGDDLDQASDLEHTVLFEYAGLSDADDRWFEDDIITSQRDLEHFEDNSGIDLGVAPDFSTTTLLASYQVHNACDPVIRSTRVRLAPGDIARLDVEVEIRDAACEYVCDGVSVTAVVVSVDSSYTGSVCSWALESCGS